MYSNDHGRQNLDAVDEDASRCNKMIAQMTNDPLLGPTELQHLDAFFSAELLPPSKNIFLEEEQEFLSNFLEAELENINNAHLTSTSTTTPHTIDSAFFSVDAFLSQQQPKLGNNSSSSIDLDNTNNMYSIIIPANNVENQLTSTTPVEQRSRMMFDSFDAESILLTPAALRLTKPSESHEKMTSYLDLSLNTLNQSSSIIIPSSTEFASLHNKSTQEEATKLKNTPPLPLDFLEADSIISSILPATSFHKLPTEIPGTVPVPVIAPRKKRHRSKELLTEEEKRANHIASEQKRRRNIRAGFRALTLLVPSLRSSAKCLDDSEDEEETLPGSLAGKKKARESIGPSKSVILAKSIDHLNFLVERNAKLYQRTLNLRERLIQRDQNK